MNSQKNKLRDIKYSDIETKETLQEKIVECLRFASLAPSVHNTQPWQVKIGQDNCQVVVDENVKLPFSDPSGRNIYISCGCFIENLLIVSQACGILKETIFFPKDDNKIVAKILFEEKGLKNESLIDLAKAITERKNIRGPFNSEKIDEGQMRTLKKNIISDSKCDVYFADSSEMIEKIGRVTEKGMKTAHSGRNFRKEMSSWLISNYSKKSAGMPGCSLNMPGPISLILPALLKNFNLGSILSKLNYLSIRSAPLVCIFSAPDNVMGWLDVGRQAQRIMLTANSLGLKTSIYVAAVEIGNLFDEIKKIINVSDRPQFLICVGKMKTTPSWFTPRKPVEKILI